MATQSIDQLPQLTSPSDDDQMIIRDDSANVGKWISIFDLGVKVTENAVRTIQTFIGDKVFSGMVRILGDTEVVGNFTVHGEFEGNIPPESLPDVPVLKGGVPKGGTAGQVIKKGSRTDYDLRWVDDPQPPAATTGVQGVTTLATASQTRNRVLETHAVTPSGLADFARHQRVQDVDLRLTTSAPATVPHQLGSIPYAFHTRLICNGDDNGYRAGDEVLIGNLNAGMDIVLHSMNASNVSVSINPGTIRIPHKTNGTLGTLEARLWTARITLLA